MKKFFRDYWELCKGAGLFVKNHWVGCIITNLISAAIAETIVFPQWPIWIWEKIKDIFSAVFYRK